MRANGRKTVHCATKANILKFTEGLLRRVFEEIAPEYPEIDSQHISVDNCAHHLVKKPEQCEVTVTTNMNGDILSDLTSALVGELEEASLIEDAIDFTWAGTGVKTRDVVGDLHSVSTTEYTEEVLGNFGKRPSKIIRREHQELRLPKFT